MITTKNVLYAHNNFLGEHDEYCKRQRFGFIDL